MRTHIAFLRGINVGGKNLLPMKRLVGEIEALGLQNISTYIQSGNVVFRSRDSRNADLTRQIQSTIKENHGFSPTVIVLDLDQLENAVASNPFPEAESEPKKLHLFFFASTPKDPDLKILENLKSDNERFEIRGTVFYLHAPEGTGRSKLAARVERSLGVSVTARNWRTVCKIMVMAQECG
jgi:uncharacterized protein (DUF1697 family)